MYVKYLPKSNLLHHFYNRNINLICFCICYQNIINVLFMKKIIATWINIIRNSTINILTSNICWCASNICKLVNFGIRINIIRNSMINILSHQYLCHIYSFNYISRLNKYWINCVVTDFLLLLAFHCVEYLVVCVEYFDLNLIIRNSMINILSHQYLCHIYSFNYIDFGVTTKVHFSIYIEVEQILT